MTDQAVPFVPDDFPPDTAEYTVSQWGGRPNYQCRFCAMDSIDVAFIREHVKVHFLPQTDRNYRPVTRTSKILDPRGQPILVTE